MMTVTSLKNTFKIHLKNLYPISEIENFFFQLIEHKIGLKRIDLTLDPNQELTSDNELYFSDALTQLKKEIPLQASDNNRSNIKMISDRFCINWDEKNPKNRQR